jgi:F0F1-type ATP synthase membrane subunit b/b'
VNAAFYEHVAFWSQLAGSLAFIACIVYGWVRFVTPAVIAQRDRKNAELFEAEKRRDSLQAEVEVARREVARAEVEADAIRARAERDAQRLHDRIIAEAQAEGERLVRNAEGELERGRLAARDLLRDELLSQAVQIAVRAAKSLEPGSDRGLIDSAVASLERGAA